MKKKGIVRKIVQSLFIHVLIYLNGLEIYTKIDIIFNCLENLIYLKVTLKKKKNSFSYLINSSEKNTVSKKNMKHELFPYA